MMKMPSYFEIGEYFESFLHDENKLTGKKWQYIIKLPNFTKGRKKSMDRQELKTKITKAMTIALPILLVAILAMLVVVALNMDKEDNYVPVFNGNMGESSTSSTTPKNNGGNIPSDPSDENNENDENEPSDPIEDPSSKGLEFESNGNGTCSLSGIGNCKDTFIIVPMESPDGDIVVAISDNAFKNSTSIKGIEFSESIKKIGAYAFYGSTIREVEIPSTVKEIGNYAFAGCKYLTAIEVDKDNSKFSSLSGVLYNSDGSILITYPAGKSDNFVNISRDVTEIANMAFYKCSSIKKVNYHGTSASWKSVEIGAGNDVIDDAIIYCAGDSGK